MTTRRVPSGHLIVARCVRNCVELMSGSVVRGDVVTRPDCRSPARAGAGIWGKLQTHVRVLGKAVETRSPPVGTRPHRRLMVQGDDERTEAVVAPYGRRKTANATAKGPAAILRGRTGVRETQKRGCTRSSREGTRPVATQWR